MSRYRIIISPRAHADTIDAFRWIAEQSPAAATRWLDGLQKAVAKLAQYPERHPIAAGESERFGVVIRQALYGRRRGVFRIFYHIESEIISVLAIRHSAREPLE